MNKHMNTHVYGDILDSSKCAQKPAQSDLQTRKKIMTGLGRLREERRAGQGRSGSEAGKGEKDGAETLQT